MWVTGPAESHSTQDCFLLFTAKVAGGGTMRYCLESFSGEPGPNQVVRDRGAMTFALPDGSVQADVRVVQRFDADSRHARQRLTGTLAGGTGRFAGVHGTIAGGGTVDEASPGHIADSALRYVLTFRPWRSRGCRRLTNGRAETCRGTTPREVTQPIACDEQGRPLYAPVAPGCLRPPRRLALQ
jgi:hypothetical protein